MTGGNRVRIPVDVITGFLGSGKTTLLNHLVKQPESRSTAVVINEFGEVGIDHRLVETSSEQMVELNNGCICCTIRGDLADKLGSLAMWLDSGRIPPVDRVVVETTGLADPAPILHTLMTDAHLLGRYRFHAVVTLVDAIAGASSLDRFAEARKQVAMADDLIVSKRDLVDVHSDRQSYAGLKRRIRRLNPRAVVHEAVNGAIDVAALIGRERDGAAAFADLAEWASAADDHGPRDPCHDDSHRHAHGEGDVRSFVVTLERRLDGAEFNAFLQALAIEFGEHLLRVKGILHVADRPDRPAVVHGVQHVFFPVTWLDGWPDEERASTLVFIVQGIEPQRIERRLRERFA